MSRRTRQGRLRETHGPNAGTIYELRDMCLLGRALDCQVHIRDLTVSRRHARIRRQDSQFVVEDLGSGNGTFVNDIPVSQHTLQHGDALRIASAAFTFEEVRTESSSVTMVGPSISEPHIVKVVDASKNILTDTEALEISGPQELADVAKRLRSVYAVTEAISSIFDVDDLLEAILERLFEVFPRAERGFIMLQDETTRELIPRAIKRAKAGDTADVEVSSTILQEVVSQRHAVLTHNAMEDQRFRSGRSVANFGIRAMMCSPLVWREDALGIVYLDSAGIAAFSQDDLELLSGISGQAAAALGNARLHAELLKRQRLAHDLQVAERIQQSFLPRHIPNVPGFVFAARYEPAFEVGGDFYDFISLPEDRLGIVLADVSGKGVAAALYMARLTRDIRYLALAETDPAAVMAKMNQAVFESGQDDMFVTAVYAVLDTRRGRLSFANAGHLPPLHRASSGKIEPMDAELAGLPLGILADASYLRSERLLSLGDSVLLFTDGLVEALSPGRTMFGVEQLQRALSKSRGTAADRLQAVLKACQQHVQDAPQFDDTTLVCLSREHQDVTARIPM